MKKPRLVALDAARMENDAAVQEFCRQMEVDVLARTLWGEARGEGVAGMKAVACVVLNRFEIAEEKGRYWWGNTIIQICQKPYQFSCWNRSDPNFYKLQDVGKDDPVFVTALRIARRAAEGLLEDITLGATHYHAKGIEPYWARAEHMTVQIGRHVFYRIGPRYD